MRCKIKGIPKANNGIQVEGNDYEMLSPNMLLLQGDSHSNGGQQITYNNTTVEAEGGEPISIDNQGNAIVYGNLTYPGTKRTFKSIAKKIGKEEGKATKVQDKATKLIIDNDPYNQYSSLSFNSGSVLQDAAQQKLQALDAQKNELADMQQFILDISEATGKKPEKVADTFTKGGKLKSYEKGGTMAINGAELQALKKKMGNVEATNSYTAQPKNEDGTYASSAYGKYQFLKGTRKDYYNKYFKDQYPTFNDFDLAFKGSPQVQEQVMDKHLEVLSKKYGGDPQYIILAHRLGEGAADSIWEKGYYTQKLDGGKTRKVTMDTPIGTGNSAFDKETPNMYLEKYNLLPSTKENDKTKGKYIEEDNISNPILPQPIIDYDVNPQDWGLAQEPSVNTRSGVMDNIEQSYQDNTTVGKPYNSINNNQPSRKPTTSAADLNKLSIADFASEIPALFDKADYVQGFQYEPQLYQPYQVSFQDRINQNNSTFRQVAQQVPNNPAALSVLSGQKYNADNQVLAEQFRTNQQIANEVTNQNTGLLNQAMMTNLQLQDQQYTRQEQARAITDSRRDQALASISGKIGQNRRDNTDIRLYENLSDYRPDENMQMQYQGGPATFGPTQVDQFNQFQQFQEMQKAAKKSTKKWEGFLPKSK